jgi:hypothetical protein
MSEERFEDTEAKDKDEDVEAHSRHSMARKAAEHEEPGNEESDDVEGHMRRASHRQA